LVANSSIVTSNQATIHRDLSTVVRKHKKYPYRRPIAAHSRTQFAHLDSIVGAHGGPVILDSGCGNGEFARLIAAKHPDHLVIGLDKSRVRIAAATKAVAAGNLVLARGDCVDLWRLACRAEWPVAQHYLLYPNPWPKAKHLQRRWHGHPIFDTLIALGGLLELRSNWEIYVAEFALALALVGFGNTTVEKLQCHDARTPFERKYLASGQPLYRLATHLLKPPSSPLRPGIAMAK